MASENASISAIEELIGEIEAYIDNCKYQPLSNTKIIVNKEEIDELLRELRMKVPEEVRRYQKIIVNKEAIMNDARNKAREMLDQTAERSDELVSDHEITRQAEAQGREIIEDAVGKAQRIIDDATKQANLMKQSAVQYTDKLLRDYEQVLNRTISTTERSYENFVKQIAGYRDVVVANREELKPALSVAAPQAAPAEPAPETNVIRPEAQEGAPEEGGEA